MLLNLLLSVIAVPVAAFLGLLLTAPVCGWPHAFPGALMSLNVPVRIRESVALVLIVTLPVIALLLIWQ